MTSTARLNEWLAEQIARGCSADAMVDAMVGAGHDRGVAKRVVAQAWAQVHGGERGDASNDDRARAVTLAAQAPNAVDAGDRRVRVLFACAQPRVVLFGDFLSHEECDALIEASRTKIQPARVVDRASGVYKTDASRTSDAAHFAHAETPIVARIERRIEALLGFEPAVQEPVQILHYGVGGEYEPHYDYFDPSEPGSKAALARGGQRIATFIMYLNDVEAGGATVFPSVGIETKPAKGNAVYFEYMNDDGSLDARTLHAGAPVGAGEKWIATKWIRESSWL